MEEKKVRSQDTPLGRKDRLQLRKESSGVRIRPWGERIGFSGGKKGQESGYAPGEKGWASVEERKVRSQETPPGRKDGLHGRKERSGVEDTPPGRKDGLQLRKERSWSVFMISRQEKGGATFCEGKKGRDSGHTQRGDGRRFNTRLQPR